MLKSDDNILKILFFGDLVGRPGRDAIKDFLKQNKQNYDFIIANVENASHGFGLTEKNYNELSEYGVDCMTSGNHIWDKKDIMFIGDFCSFLAKYEIGIDYYSAYINIFFKDPNYSLIVKICNDSYGFSYSGLLDLLFLKYNILTEKDEVTKLLIDMAKICNQPFYNLPDIYSYLHNLLKDLTKDKQLLDFENFRLVEQLKNFINLQDEDLKAQITQELADILSQTISDEEKLTGCLTIIKKYEVNSLTRIKPNENE